MTLHYCGEVNFSKPITEEQRAHVRSILERENLFDPEAKNNFTHIQEDSIYFEDTYDPEDAIREIQKYLATSAENPVELSGELSYWGDYEGGVIITPESIESLDPGPFYIRVDACDEELVAELARRYGFIRRIDSLRQIVIPEETRQRCYIHEGDALEIAIGNNPGEIVLRWRCDVSDEELIAELVRRGYAVPKKEENAEIE